MLSCHTAFMLGSAFILSAIFLENTSTQSASRRMILVAPLVLLGGIALYAVNLMGATHLTAGIVVALVLSAITAGGRKEGWSFMSVSQAAVMMVGAFFAYHVCATHGMAQVANVYLALTVAFIAIAIDREGFFLKQCYRDSPLLALGAVALAPFVLVFIAVHYVRQEREASSVW